MKVLFNHGQDPQIGNKILGPIDELSADDDGPLRYRVPLFDTAYNRDLGPALRPASTARRSASRVEEDTWDQKPRRSDHNPDGIPERTITEARVCEFGPVTFPANPNASRWAPLDHRRLLPPQHATRAVRDLLRSAQVARQPQPAAAPAPVNDRRHQ